MYISYKAHNRFTKETLLIVSDVDVYMFPVLRSIPSCTTDMNLRSCILNRHKMRQSQIATIQESMPSHFVICRILWSWPWWHKMCPITLKTCSGYLGEYPCSLLTWIWKVSFLPILALFHWYICLFVCLSVIKLIIDVPRKPCWKGPILMWTCFLHLGVHPRLLWNLSEQLWLEPSQNTTVTNCDNSGILAVAFCDLSHFVIMAMTAHTESNNTENVFWVLGRVPRFIFDTNMKSFIFAHFGVISLLYLFVCMYISYKAHNRFTKENLIDSVRRRCVHFSCTEEYTLLHYGHESEKLHFEPSQNATVTNCDNSGILAVAFCDLSHFVIMAVTAQNESNNTENVFWVLRRVPMFTFDMNMKSFIFAHFGVISLLYLFLCMHISYKAHNRFTKETLLIVSDIDVYMFPVLRSIPSCTTDMNLRSCILNRHKMRQSQIATIQESLPSHFVICRILWSWPWRHKMSPITLKTCSGYLGEYPCSLLTWIWKVSFLPILALFHCYICLCVCISVIKPIIDLQRKPYW